MRKKSRRIRIEPTTKMWRDARREVWNRWKYDMVVRGNRIYMLPSHFMFGYNRAYIQWFIANEERFGSDPDYLKMLKERYPY